MIQLEKEPDGQPNATGSIMYRSAYLQTNYNQSFTDRDFQGAPFQTIPVVQNLCFTSRTSSQTLQAPTNTCPLCCQSTQQHCFLAPLMHEAEASKTWPDVASASTYVQQWPPRMSESRNALNGAGINGSTSDLTNFQLHNHTSILHQEDAGVTAHSSQKRLVDSLQKREFRLMKNREAARECRRKKKEYVKCLENRVAMLENLNKALIEEIRSLKHIYQQNVE